MAPVTNNALEALTILWVLFFPKLLNSLIHVDVCNVIFFLFNNKFIHITPYLKK